MDIVISGFNERTVEIEGDFSRLSIFFEATQVSLFLPFKYLFTLTTLYCHILDTVPTLSK